MISNYILGEVVDFDRLFKELEKYFDKKTKIFALSGIVLSSYNQEYTYKYYNCEKDIKESLFPFIHKLDFSKSNGTRNSETVRKYELDEEEKFFGDEYFEFCLAVYSKFEFEKNLIGVLYLAIESDDQYLTLAEVDKPKLMACIENTFYMIQSKIDLYDKLYYTIDLFTEILSVKENFLPFHITNVTNWCLKISKKLNLTNRDTLVLYVSALMHDLGNVYLPDRILNKHTSLSKEEFRIIKTHPGRSAEIVKSEMVGLEFFKDVPEIIKSHHERLDGAGYPEGLKGDEIPFLTRILSVADSVDAMLSGRAYKEKRSEMEVITELKRCRNSRYDSHIIDTMIEILMESRNNFEIKSVVGTNYIPFASVAYYYKDVTNFNTYTGNVVINQNEAKLISHDTIGSFKKLDFSKMHRASISFYSLNNIFEYNVEVTGVCDDQLILNNFEFKPLDRYFSVVWEVEAKANFKNLSSCYVKIIKMSGDTLIFEVIEANSDYFVEHKGDVLKMNYKLDIDNDTEDISIDGRIVKYYNFGGKYVFYVDYINLTDNQRDHLIKILFRKQLYERKKNNDNRFDKEYK